MTQAQRVANERILVNTAATVSAQFVDQYGDPADPGTVTAHVVAEDGTEVVAAGTATGGSSTSPRTLALTYSQVGSQTNFYTVTWSGSSTGTLQTLVEVVSGYYFTEAQARAHKHGLMNSTTDYPSTQMRTARLVVEHEFERVCWPFIPRYRRVRVSCTNDYRLWLPDMYVRNIRSVRAYAADGVTYTAYTAAQLAAISVNDSGLITSNAGPFYGYSLGLNDLVIEYEYGFDRPEPRVVDAALARLRYIMNSDRSGIPERAQSFQAAEGGGYSLTVAGKNGSITGMPDVDVVLKDPRYRRFAVGVA
jgi:hypothetical protein